MQKTLFLGCALSFQIMAVQGMDSTSPALLHQSSGGQGLCRNTNHAIAPEEQRRMDLTSLTKVSAEEVDTLLRQKEGEHHAATFGMYTASGTFIDGHINTVHVNQDVLVKEQVIPLLIKLRLALAKEQSLGIAEDELRQGITANVLAVWKARKK